MHINANGANINITVPTSNLPNSQNNFIFNHTAPINLNFYKDKDNIKNTDFDPEIVA